MGVIDINGNIKEVKVLNERQYRTNLIREAKIKGCEKELRLVFEKYDNLLRNCTNSQEREHIGMLGVLEVSRLLDNGHVGKGGCVTVNGQVIIADEDYKIETDATKDTQDGE